MAYKPFPDLDDGRCLVDVIDDPDALTSFLTNNQELGLDSTDLDEFSRYQLQPSHHGSSQYAPGPNIGGSTMHQETPSSVLMRLENISPPPMQNSTVLGLLGDRPFTPTSHTTRTNQPAAANRPIIDLGFGEQEGGEIKEIFPDFLSSSARSNQEAFLDGEDLIEKLSSKGNVAGAAGNAPATGAKDDFSSIFSFEDDEKSIQAIPPSSLSTGNVQDVIQQSLLLSGVGDLSSDMPEEDADADVKVVEQSGASEKPPQSAVASQHSLAISHSMPISSSSVVQAPVVQGTVQDGQRMPSRSIPQVAVVRPQTQPQPPSQTQLPGNQAVMGSQGQVVSSQFMQAPSKVMVSGQQGLAPMQQAFVYANKAPLSIHQKPGMAGPTGTKQPSAPAQGIRIMLAPQTGGNIATIGGSAAGGTIQLNQGQPNAAGQQTVVLQNIQGAVQPGPASSMPVLQPVITIGATQGSLIFMTRPTTVLAPQQIQQLQTTGSGLATIQMPNQAIGSVVPQGAIAVNQQAGGKQTLPVVQLLQSGVTGGKAIQTITLPQGYVTGGQTIVIQNPQQTPSVLPIAQSQARIVQAGTGQVNFVQTQAQGSVGKVQGTPQLIQPKVVSAAQSFTKGLPAQPQSIAPMGTRAKEIAASQNTKIDNTAVSSPAQLSAAQQGTMAQQTSSTALQIQSKPVHVYIQDGGHENTQAAAKSVAATTTKTKPVQTFHHKLYGKISTVHPETKTSTQSGTPVSQVPNVTSSLILTQTPSVSQTILHKIQPQAGEATQLSLPQTGHIQSSVHMTSSQPKPIYVEQKSPPATTTVTPSNFNAKGLPKQTQPLPGDNGSVPASVQQANLTQSQQDSTTSPIFLSESTTSVTQNANSVPAKLRIGGTQLKKQNLYGSQGVRPNTTATVSANTYQAQFLRSLQPKVAPQSQTSSALSSLLTTTCTSSVATSDVVATVTSQARQEANPLGSGSNVNQNQATTFTQNQRSDHSKPATTMAQNTQMISALELKVKHMQEQGLQSLSSSQPMVSALELKAQLLPKQGTNLNQSQLVQQTRPMLSALQIKNAVELQGQGMAMSNSSSGQPMISALQLQQQLQQHAVTGSNAQTRPMLSALELQQLQRQGTPVNTGTDVARLTQLLQIQQKQKGAKPVANQLQGAALANPPQSQPAANHVQIASHLSGAQPMTSPQAAQIPRPPSTGQPLPSPQGSQNRRPGSVGQPIPSPQSNQMSRPPSVSQSLPSPQGVPYQPLPSPQSVSSQPVQSPQSVSSQMTPSPQSRQGPMMSPPSAHPQMMQPVQGKSFPPTQQGGVVGQSLQQSQVLQSSSEMMPQLLQAFDLLKRAQGAQAKGEAGAPEQAHYMQKFNILLQKHPELKRQLQHLKQKQQMAKQQNLVHQQQMGSSMPATSFKQAAQAVIYNQQQLQQQQKALSASAGQAQLVASSILQATQMIGANASHVGGQASGTVPSTVPSFIRPGGNGQSATLSQDVTNPAISQSQFIAHQNLVQAKNPNYTPNVNMQTANLSQKDGLPPNISSQGLLLSNQRPSFHMPLKRKTPPPSTAMPPPPPPSGPPPNVSILPSSKQSALGTPPAITKEKDVFEFEDDEPEPPKLESKFSLKHAGSRAVSGTVHHQPAPIQQGHQQSLQPPQLSQNQSFQVSQSGPQPFQGVPNTSIPFQGSQVGQTPSKLGQTAMQTQSSSSQASQLTQGPPVVSSPSPVPSQGAPSSHIQAGSSNPAELHQMIAAKVSAAQAGAPTQGGKSSQPGSQRTQSGAGTRTGRAPAAGTQYAHTSVTVGRAMTAGQTQENNVASRRLQQLQQSSSMSGRQQKSPTAHQISRKSQESLHSVKGFIRQLEAIHNRTPKQEAMRLQLLDLQDKLNAAAHASLNSHAARSSAAAAAAATAAGSGGVSNVAGGNVGVSATPQAAAVAQGASSVEAAPVPTAASASLADPPVSEASSSSFPPNMGIKQEAGGSQQQPTQMSLSGGVSSGGVLSGGVSSGVAPGIPSQAQQIFTTKIVQLVGKNLTPQQQDVLKRLQEQLRNMTPQQQQEFYRQHHAKLQQMQVTKKPSDQNGAIQPPQQPSSSTITPKPQLSPVRAAKPARSKAKKKTSKSPKGADRMDKGDAEKGAKDVEVVTATPQAPPPPPPPPPRVPTPPPDAADFIRERRSMDVQLVESQFKTSFASYQEAVMRLLPYHIVYEKIPSKEKFAETESSFHEISDNLMEKKQKMLNKFQLLLHKESMKKEPSSEIVMLERMFLADERAALQYERELAEANRGLVESLMPKIEATQDKETDHPQSSSVEKPAEHKFVEPSDRSAVKVESRHKTNHDRLRRSADTEEWSESSTSPPPRKSVMVQKRSSLRQRLRSSESDSTSAPSVESRYESSIVSKYGSSDEEDGSSVAKGTAFHSGGGIRLRLTKSLLVESNVMSRDKTGASESDDSILSSPSQPKRRKSQLEALLSSDSLDSERTSPSLDHRTKATGVWSIKRPELSPCQDSLDASTRDTDGSQGAPPSGSHPATIHIDSPEEEKDALQEQMDSAVNSILFLQNPRNGSDASRHASFADISFGQSLDDVFDSGDDSAVFNVDDYANASFLEESSAVAGLESEFSAMGNDL
ncbi:uncharacterized protein [Diadema setosum]|uniref:uncharacterized protein n=1 Tax=Diadema setosum TaxID=31175 RepID=UPI003B3BE979